MQYSLMQDKYTEPEPASGPSRERVPASDLYILAGDVDPLQAEHASLNWGPAGNSITSPS